MLALMFENMKTKRTTDATTTTPSRSAAKQERPGGRFQTVLRTDARQHDQRRGIDQRRDLKLRAVGPRHPIWGLLH
jgi:hypothetical protein